jgi:serine/threonine protein kinase
MLTGRHLFFGGPPGATIARVLLGAIPALSTIREVSPELDSIVMKLLARNPPNRYATAEDALASLLQCPEWPRSGRDELSALLAGRFGRAHRPLLSVADPEHRIPVEDPSLETRTSPPSPPPRDVDSFDWEAYARKMSEAPSYDGKRRRTIASTSTKRPRRARSRHFLVVATVALAMLAGVGYVVRGSLERPPLPPASDSTIAAPIQPALMPLAAPPPRIAGPPAPAAATAPTSPSGAARRERATRKRVLPPPEEPSPTPSRYPETMRNVLGDPQ